MLESLLFLSSIYLGFIRAFVEGKGLAKLVNVRIHKFYFLADFMAQWLTTYNLIMAGFKKTIKWSGKEYNLRESVKNLDFS